MRISLPRKRACRRPRRGRAAGGCSTDSTPQPPPGSPTSATSPAPASAKLVSASVDVPGDLAQAPFDEPRQALVPAGWTMSVWARIPKARLAAWTPDGALLVSVPARGQIVKLTPKPAAAPQESVLLEGLDQPHGMAFAGSTLYVAESDQIDVYDYADGAATSRRTIAAGLPDERSPELHGAYAHALKSVAVGPDGAVYFSIGSTGNITAQDRDATPAASDHHADPARRRPGPAVRDGRPQWNRPRDRTRRIGVDGGQQPRQRSGPGRRRRHRIRQRAPARVPGPAHPRPRTRLAVLQSRRRPRRSVLRPRRVHQRRRVARWTAPSCPRSNRASARTRRRSDCPSRPASCRSRMPAERWWACTARGTGEPPRAPEVSFFPWRNGDLGDQQTLVGGFQAADGSRWGRPVAAVVGPDGAVYVTDDYAGAVYRLAPPGR